jgi:hypothetical protein
VARSDALCGQGRCRPNAHSCVGSRLPRHCRRFQTRLYPSARKEEARSHATSEVDGDGVRSVPPGAYELQFTNGHGQLLTKNITMPKKHGTRYII